MLSKVILIPFWLRLMDFFSDCFCLNTRPLNWIFFAGILDFNFYLKFAPALLVLSVFNGILVHELKFCSKSKLHSFEVNATHTLATLDHWSSPPLPFLHGSFVLGQTRAVFLQVCFWFSLPIRPARRTCFWFSGHQSEQFTHAWSLFFDFSLFFCLLAAFRFRAARARRYILSILVSLFFDVVFGVLC